MITAPKSQKPPKIQTMNSHAWTKGYNSHTDPTRSDPKALATADNVILEQDGVVRPRPSLIEYGEQPTGTVLGLDEFTKLNGSTPETYLIMMMVDGGVGKIYVSKDAGTWTLCAGKTYDSEAKARFVQGAGKVLIMNGVDNLSYLDTTTLDIEVFSALTTPGAPIATPTGLSGSTVTYRYRVSALNDVGETAASTAATATVGTDRDSWDPATQYVTLTWSAVSGANGYAVYLGLSAGKETLITTLPSTSLSYKDTGVAPQVATRLAPAGNSTEGPITKSGANVAGQIVMIGDKDYPYRAWFGGSGEDALDFSPFNGGGWIDISLGGKDIPVRVVSFRDGKGTPMATILMKGTNGSGKLVHLTLETQSLADVIISYMAAYEANGQDGTDAPDGVVVYKDSLWYPSADGFKTTGTKPQIQNILSTNNISDTIETDVAKLNRTSMDNSSGVAYEGRIYWALPVGTSTNNQIWVLDLARGGQWMLPWRVNADQLLLYGDNDGNTHFLAVVGNKILEFTRSVATTDDGTGFPTKVGSGYIKADESGLEWFYIIDVTFVLINPQGVINLDIRGKTEDSAIAQVGAKTFTRNTQYAGWGELTSGATSGWGVPLSAESSWGEIVTVPSTYGSSRVVRTVEIGEVLNYMQWEIGSLGGADYALSDVIIRYVNVGAIITEEMES